MFYRTFLLRVINYRPTWPEGCCLFFPFIYLFDSYLVSVLCFDTEYYAHILSLKTFWSRCLFFSKQGFLITFSTRCVLSDKQICFTGHFSYGSSTVVRHDLKVVVYSFLSFTFSMIIYFDILRFDTTSQLKCMISNYY